MEAWKENTLVRLFRWKSELFPSILSSKLYFITFLWLFSMEINSNTASDWSLHREGWKLFIVSPGGDTRA